MEFCREVESLNSGALQIIRQGMEFAARIGQMALGKFGNNQAAAFRANFQTVKIGGGAFQGIVRCIQAVQHAGMCGVVQTVSTKQKMQIAQRLDHVSQTGIARARALARSRSGLVPQATKRGRLRRFFLIQQK
jgi:hypothetical protein